ncbi:redoxin domain-containing protein [Parasediminibacterium sp. JCM 36343]|uniref:redoxin domain-containing protein n=1 Tax=Parasediminibacterium sp. JCM 36343 TaxID=3374279 RepID=UPI00397A33B7
MRKFVIALLYIAFAVSCKQKTTSGSYTISGKIDSAASGEMIVCRQTIPEAKPDTAYLAKDGSFTFKNTIAEPTLANIYFPASVQESQQAITLFLEPGNIDITGKKSDLNNAMVNGGNSNKELSAIMGITKTYTGKMKLLEDSIKKRYEAHDTAAIQSLQTTGMSLDSEEKQAITQNIKNNPKSYVSAFFAYQLNSYDSKLQNTETAYNSLDASIQQSYYGKKLKQILDALKSTAVGTLAPSFTSNNINGQPVSLASFKGKYVLLDFWASWCGPCRQENPNVVKAYSQFKDKNFTIVGISLDEDKAAWQQAIATDHLAWNQLSDLQGWKSSTANTYGVQSIPANFLLDPTGKIIAKDLRGTDLINALAGIFK